MTNDIAVGLRIRAEAERIKQRYGYALTSIIGDDETIEVPSVGGRDRKPAVGSFSVRSSSRGLKMYNLIHGEIQRSGFGDLLASGSWSPVARPSWKGWSSWVRK